MFSLFVFFAFIAFFQVIVVTTDTEPIDATNVKFNSKNYIENLIKKTKELNKINLMLFSVFTSKL